MTVKRLIKELVYRLRGEYTTDKLISMGMSVGKGFGREEHVILDPSFCWLITIGDHVTLAPNVTVLCHDASIRKHIGFTRIGRVDIGNNVFVGAGSCILPGVKIGDNSIIAAHSVVTKDVPSNVVVGGVPAKVVCELSEHLERKKREMNSTPFFDRSYSLSHGCSIEKRNEMRERLSGTVGYID